MSQGNYECKVETKTESIQKDLSEFGSSENSNQPSEEAYKEGKWTDQENLRFVLFITLNNQIFKSKEKRKAQKIFKNLAVFLETRNARQCRSHFQKAIKKFSTIIKMKNFYRKLLGDRLFEAKIEQFRPEIERINEDIKFKESKSAKMVEAEVQTDPFVLNLGQFPGFQHYNFTEPQQYYWFPSFCQ